MIGGRVMAEAVKTELVLVCAAPERRTEAEGLAARLGLTLSDALPQDAAALVFEPEGLTLRRGALSVRGDFTQMLPRLRAQNLRSELLVRAVKGRGASRPLRVVDATAGLGEDAILLAAAGHSVQMFEQNPVIAAMLRDALDRAAQNPALAEIVGRMTLTEGNSIDGLRSLGEAPDAVVLDPMFPERKKSGLIGKKLELLQVLERPCEDEAALLAAAEAAHPAKIVIKRPQKGPYLAGRTPGYSLIGKAIRYDVIVPRRTAFAM